MSSRTGSSGQSKQLPGSSGRQRRKGPRRLTLGVDASSINDPSATSLTRGKTTAFPTSGTAEPRHVPGFEP